MTNCGCTAGDALEPASKNAGLARVTPGRSSTEEPPIVSEATATCRDPVVARLTAACRLLAASRRGSTCSECVAPAHTVKPTATATSATDAATGIRTDGSSRTHHQHPTATAAATGHPSQGDHQPSAEKPAATELTATTHRAAPTASAGRRRGFTTPGWRCAR